MKKHLSISLCLIVRNEEANLPACLASAASLADEVVVMDTGSSDDTRAVARRLGARVASYAWRDDFAAARNECIGQATGAWIFWLDADERLDADNHARLRQLFAELKDENAAYSMRVRSSGQPGPDVQVRLFRNQPQLRWQHRVRERILPALEQSGAAVRHTDITIDHLGFHDPDLRHAKLERNLRLLRLENAEHPDDPFVLFHLGLLYLNFGHAPQAVSFWRRSLEGCEVSAPFLGKLFLFLAQTQAQLGQRTEALATLGTGLAHFPDDVELLFLNGVLLAETGAYAEAEDCLMRSLWAQELAEAAGRQARAPTYMTHHYLAGVHCALGRPAEAEAAWSKAQADCPSFTPAARGLGELYAGQRRWDEFAQICARLESDPQTRLDGATLRAAGHLARAEFAAARQLLDAVLQTAPQAVWPREIHSRVLLQEGTDWIAAEDALRALLALDPNHVEARSNLQTLREMQATSARPAGPPGPASRGWRGQARDFARDPLGFLAHCACAYGNIVAVRFGREPVFLLNHPEHIEHVLVTANRNFTKGCKRHFQPLFGAGLFMSDGDVWRRQRRLAQPAFQRQRLAFHASSMVALTERMLASWQDGEIRDLHQDMMRLLLEIMAQTIFALDVDEAHHLGAALETATRYVEAPHGRFPWLTSRLPTPHNLRLRRAVRRLNAMLYERIGQLRAGGNRQSSLLAALLATRAEPEARGLTDRQLRDEAMNWFVAGRETTALALAWTWHLLAHDPVVTHELESELAAVLGGRAPSVEDLPGLRYTEWVVLEAMRLFPPAYALKRQALADDTIGGYRIPAGATLILPQWVLHRDPRFFAAPEQFQPNRWADGLAERLPHFAYFPFGGGPRLCIGNALAMTAATLVLATMAQKIRVAPAPGHTVTLAPAATLRPAQGIKVVVRHRRSLPAENAPSALRDNEVCIPAG
jgi:cytochrome P450/tetratricopeptide (TPR) repeat protein